MKKLYKFLIFIILIFFTINILFVNKSKATGDWVLEYNFNYIDYTLNLTDEFWNVQNPFDGNKKESDFFIIFNDKDDPYMILWYQKYKMDNCFYIENNNEQIHFLKANNDCLFSAYINGNNIKWNAVLRDGLSISNTYKVVYSTCDIRYTDGSIFYNGYSSNFKVYVHPTEPTDFVNIISNNFNSEYYNIYDCYISGDNINWSVMNKQYSVAGDTDFVFYSDIYKNGTYYLKLVDNITDTILYTNQINVTNVIEFDWDKLNLSITLSNTNPTYEPIILYANYSSGYTISTSISSDGVTYKDMTYIPTTEENIYRNQALITKNGLYYIKFLYVDDNNELHTIVKTIDITNILVDTEIYVPTPKIFVDYNKENNTIILKTQNLYYDRGINLKCYYSTDSTNDNDIYSWPTMNIFFNNYSIENPTESGFNEVYFYIEIPFISARDTTYLICFYDYINDIRGGTTTYKFVLDDVLSYIENNFKEDLGISFKLNKLYNTFYNKLGFITYPFEFVGYFCNSLLNIEYTEPLIKIPDLYEPFYNNKILNSIEFNFNSLLENPIYNFIHEIYLLAVDFILIFLLIKLCFKVFMEVFDN